MDERDPGLTQGLSRKGNGAMDRYPLELPGYHARSPQFKEVVNPYDREPIAAVEYAAEEAIDSILDTARTQRDAWRRTPA